MRRRSLLSAVSALAFGGLSGCLSAFDGETPERTETPEPLPPPGDGSLSEFDAGDPFETRRVGEPSDDAHHRAVIWNDDARRREIDVSLAAVDGDDPALDVAPTFPPYGSLHVEVFRPRDYVLDVSPPESADRRLGIRRDFVDCNDSETHVAVRPDGSVRARVISTALACDVATATSEGSPARSESSLARSEASSVQSEVSSARTGTNSAEASSRSGLAR